MNASKETREKTIRFTAFEKQSWSEKHTDQGTKQHSSVLHIVH